MRRLLVTILVIAALVGLWFAFRPGRPDPLPETSGPRLLWVFEAPRPGMVVATPCVTPHVIYLAVAHSRGFQRTGAVYAIDPTNGKPRWMFDHDGTMLPTASSPLAVGGRLYVGDGMHGDFACGLHCLDAATGASQWEFPTGDHIEGAPAEEGGTVVFPAGNDGLYTIDATTAALRWNFRADLHIDASPHLSAGRVFFGSGKSRRFDTYQVICLELRSGKPVWRTPVNLPAWGAPVVADGRVYIGLGNGRLTESARAPESPAGALACLDAANGTLVWAFPVAYAVFGQPGIFGDRVLFGSRDGYVYGVSPDGHEAFRVTMGGPVVAGIVGWNETALAVSVPGRIVCVEIGTGRELWRHELGRPGAEPRVFATPVIADGRLYIAAEMATGDTSIITLYCFELPMRRGSES